jgi:UDP-N-acetylglucosamine 2-epimerase (non-hydrolysing)
MSHKIVTVCGIRPDFIRLSQVIKGLDADPEIEHVLLHTGQHYKPTMDRIFFDEFNLRSSDINLAIGRDSDTAMGQIGLLFPRLEEALLQEKPDAVVYLGDTNTAVSAIVPARMNIPVIRIEAGMRAYDHTLPEEINRKAADSIAALKIAYLPEYKMQLVMEGHEPESVIVTGNPIVDVVNWGLKKYNINPYAEEIVNMDVAEAPPQSDPGRSYTLATFHRANNILSDARLQYFVEFLNRLAYEGERVIFSCYYRTADRIKECGLELDSRIMIKEPTNFGEFLRLEAGASIILTDSGTSQEESLLLNKPCMVLRDSTERPETLMDSGGNAILWSRISDVDWISYQTLAEMAMYPNLRTWDRSIYGDGHASKRIVDAITKFVKCPEFPFDFMQRKYIVKRFS